MKRSTADAGTGPALWGGAGADPAMLAYTIGDDRELDARLLPWDIIGSLGHLEGLLRSGLVSRSQHSRLRAGLRAALRAADDGKLTIGEDDEDVHSAVEKWLGRRTGAAGGRIHTGRSRNDQIACDLRLFQKHRLLEIHSAAGSLAGALLEFAGRHRRTLWPGYTHTRGAMPSTAGLWAGAHAEGLLDTLESLPALWAQVDRSPLGSAAGYGVPLPLDREAVQRALGFGGLDHNVAAVQNGRGKLEAGVLFWCVQLSHDMARLASDGIMYSADEYGLLILPPAYTTGSSIMPQKRNPDVFEITRARAAGLAGDLVTVLSLRGNLTSGYHRDFQLLKGPLFRGLDHTLEMTTMLGTVVPALEVNREAARERLSASGILVTDEVMRRVSAGESFREVYHEVAGEFHGGKPVPPPRESEILGRRLSTGAPGNPDLQHARRRLRATRTWRDRESRRFMSAVRRLAGRGGFPA
ncbi:MAG: lyase family protein [Gemmatimonadales bacterium]